jgi:DNA-binding NarL/FixJ family response regulator
MKITIFLADDHAVFREGLRLLIETGQEFEVVGEAGDGRTAVRKVAQLRPQIVIMDIAMPELNGIEATRQIIENHPEIKVIILSEHSAPHFIIEALKAGARGYLLKKSPGAEIIRALSSVHKVRLYLSKEVSEKVVDDYLAHYEAITVRSPLARLSPREKEVLQLIAEGKSTSEIAGILPLTCKTVATYRSRLMQKLGIHSLSGLIRFALEHGLLQLG